MPLVLARQVSKFGVIECENDRAMQGECENLIAIE